MTSLSLQHALTCVLPIERYRMVNDKLPSVADIESGIVFVHAAWSGASILAFRALNKAIAKCADTSGLQLFVIDTDSPFADEWWKVTGDTPAGAGETYWIKGGQIRARMRAYSDVDAVQVGANTEMVR